MRYITLTQNKAASVSDEDYEDLSKWKWYYLKRRKERSGYAARMHRENGFRKTIYMHREILFLKDGEMCDHIDCNGINNQRENLRRCTFRGNFLNKQKIRHMKGKSPSSRFKGVCFKKSSHKWNARIIGLGKRRFHLGYFNTEEAAARAYNEAAKRIWGDKVLLNKLD